MLSTKRQNLPFFYVHHAIRKVTVNMRYFLLLAYVCVPTPDALAASNALTSLERHDVALSVFGTSRGAEEFAVFLSCFSLRLLCRLFCTFHLETWSHVHS